MRYALAAVAALVACAPAGAAVTQVDYESLTGTQSVSFAGFTSLSYNNTIIASGVGFSEHFAGQSVTDESTWDVVSGAPTSPLVLEAGLPGRNVGVGSQVAVFGRASDAGIDGRGALSILFSADESQFGLTILNSDSTIALPSFVLFTFFDAAGATIGQFSVDPGLGTPSVGFTGSGIRGVQITNNDRGGALAYSNFKFDTPSTFQGAAAPVPEPSSWALLLVGFGLVGAATRARARHGFQVLS